ncbi:hypothetical protein FRB94_007120 [Tulasnella sp. JGI-2019a]|nr:hypothetical protein FRB93_012439 [Tulasnella sp. JGI-2019a]KAG9011927.1 hypothetical protein FRB94_007120 [Tulasnella sp. JGI-2019a]
MPSIFSRTRPSSSKSAGERQVNSFPIAGPSNGYDEFGQPPGMNLSQSRGFSVTSKLPKEKAAGRIRTLSTQGAAPVEHTDTPPAVSAPAFLPLRIPPKREVDVSERDYGYICAESDVILALEDVERLVSVVGDEIISRALTTPLLFSSHALDVSANRVRSLVRSFLASCHRPSAPTGDAKWREDARLAGSHELGMLLRWGLARVMREVDGREIRGILDWDVYVQWKLDEEAFQYPPTHFILFLQSTQPFVRPILEKLIYLFSRLTAHSSQSGLTPIALSTLFGPLLFGLGPACQSFVPTYAAYLRSSHATEHLLLSYLRNTEVESRQTATEMPSRLRDWIRGYPVMIPPLKDLEKPRRLCKLVKVVSARRYVKLYSPDLVKTAAGWGREGDLTRRSEWRRITAGGGSPRYTDSYRRRLNIPAKYAPSIASVATARSSLESAGQPSTVTTSTTNGRSGTYGASLDDGSEGRLGLRDTDHFRSLTDMQWGEFSELGFGSSDTKRLQFDLNEGARLAVGQKRATMTWNDFSSVGFTREDAPLQDTLQFTPPLSSSSHTLSSQSDDIHRKLKKNPKAPPQFNWDITPVAGQDWTVEEGFISCWADLLLSSDWNNRRERTFKDVSWAMVEFEAAPLPVSDDSLMPDLDQRTSSQWMLFEEQLPEEYREQVLNPQPKKAGKTSYFTTPMSRKGRKSAATSNGRHPDPREADFDAMLRATGSSTTFLSLGASRASGAARSQTMSNLQGARLPTGNHTSPAPGFSSISTKPTFFRTSSNDGNSTGAPATPSKDKASSAFGLFKLAGGSGKKGDSKVASEYDPSLDFETKTASDSSGGELPTPSGRRGVSSMSHARRQSKDDAWVDILVSDRRRLGGQDAVSTKPMGGPARLRTAAPESYFDHVVASNTSTSTRTPRASLSRTRSDPELGREELSRMVPLSEYSQVDMDNRYTMTPLEDSASYLSSGEEEEVMSVPRASVIETSGGPPIRMQPTDRLSAANLHRLVMEEDEEQMVERGTEYQVPADEPPSSQASSTDSSLERPAVLISAASPHVKMTSNVPQLQSTSTPGPVRKGTGGGISSLIEMYAKKDEDASRTIHEPKASRLPVRTTTSSGSPIPPAPTSVTPPLGGLTAAVTVPARTPSPNLLPPAPLEDPINRLQTPSPLRYVHGAPLHNVLEEESEEEA